MNRGMILKLSEKAWIDIPGTDLKVAIIPKNAVDVAGASAKTLADRVFVDFKNYTDDDGNAVANSIEARMELLAVLPIRAEIVSKVIEINQKVIEGEGGSA